MVQDNISAILGKIEKDFGKGVAVVASKVMSDVPNYRIPSGITRLDFATLGGLKRGTISIFQGPESGGKTLTSLRYTACAQRLCRYLPNWLYDLPPFVVDVQDMPRLSEAEIQRLWEEKETALSTAKNAAKEKAAEALYAPEPMLCAFIDVEGTLDFELAKAVGVDLERLIYVHPETAEDAADVVTYLLDTSQVDLVVVDSVAAFVPKNNLVESIDKKSYGGASQLITRAVQRWSAKLFKSGILAKSFPCVIVINQIRSNVGSFGGLTTPCGHALRHHSSLTINFRRGRPMFEGPPGTWRNKEEEKDTPLSVFGGTTEFSVVKSKISMCPYKGEYVNIFRDVSCAKAPEFIVSKGATDNWIQLVSICVELGLIVQSGTWFSLVLGDTLETLGQGQEKVGASFLYDLDLWTRLAADAFVEYKKTVGKTTNFKSNAELDLEAEDNVE